MQCQRCQTEGDGNFCASCGASLSTGKKPGMSGCGIAAIVFGVLAVLAVPIIGIIAAIAIPNFLNAVQRGKQKRTMGDVRTIATAVESYSIDHQAYPLGGESGEVSGLSPVLSPTYIKALPVVDGWNVPFHYESDGTGYLLKSSGKDGVMESPPPAGTTQRFDADIVFQDGSFTAYPEGVQH